MSLTDEQVRMLRGRLKERFARLRGELSQELRASDEDTYIELAGRVHDAGEASVAELLKDLNLANVDRHIEEIRAIDAALMRLANHTYGVCSDCRAPIPFQRLSVQPTAVRCQACQARWEKTGRAAARPGPTL
jgi:RNA polymerase-binding protein DksA